VGAAAFYNKDTQIMELKYRLLKDCSNNQWEEIPVLKSLQKLKDLQINNKTVTIHTESKVTLTLLTNNCKHYQIIESIPSEIKIL